MSHPYFHSKSSVRKFGGKIEDYLPIHNWFDQTKGYIADARHRMILHNSFGIFLCEQVFGVVYKRPSDGKEIPTRIIGEQHVLEDYGGRIPSLSECLQSMTIEEWMWSNAVPLSNSKQLPKRALPEYKEDNVPQEYKDTMSQMLGRVLAGDFSFVAGEVQSKITYKEYLKEDE